MADIDQTTFRTQFIAHLKEELTNLIRPAALYEINDLKIRSSIVEYCNLFLDNACNRIADQYNVVCDESNNNPSVVDSKKLIVDFAIKFDKNDDEFYYFDIIV